MKVRRATALAWEVEGAAGPTQGRKLDCGGRPSGNLDDCIYRARGSLTFRLVQVLSRYGCFGKYLCCIARREPTTGHHHCSCDEDTVHHTLEVCPARASERHDLVAVGGELSLPALVKSMLESDRSWEVLSFCEQEREVTIHLPIRNRIAGRLRRLFHALPSTPITGAWAADSGAPTMFLRATLGD